MTIRDIFISFGYEVDKTSEKKANDSIKSLKSTATKLLGAIGIAFSLVSLKNLAEEFNGINDQIKDATRGMGEQKDIQQAIMKAANGTRQSYADMADTVSKIAQNKDVFANVEEASYFSELLYKNFMATGKSAEESHALIKTMTTSIAKGAVDSRMMMRMFQESPSTLNMVAESLGVSIEVLQEMVNQGQVSAETLKQVFESNAGAIEERFGELDYSISDALLNIRNQWGYYIDGLNSSLGLTQSIAKFMVKSFEKVMAVLNKLTEKFLKLADKIGGVENMMKLLTIAAGAIFIVLKADKVLLFIKNIGAGIKGINIKMLAIVAVIVLLALLIDDLVNFMNGDNSLMGELFKKFGIDGEMVRETIRGLLDAGKELLTIILDLGKKFGKSLLDALKKLLPLLFELAKKIIPPLIDFIKRIVTLLIDVGKKIIPVIISVIEKLVPFLINIIERILPVAVALIEKLLPFIAEVAETVLPVILELIESLLPVFFEIIETVLPVILELIDMLLPLILQIADTVLPVILEIITAILPIITLLVESVLPIILELIEAILPVIMPIVELIANLAADILPIIVDFLNIITPILETVLSVLKPIAEVVGTVVEGIGGFVGKAVKGIGDFFSGDKKDKKDKKTKGYARGTSFSDDTFIAGEQGPELITGAKGRKVFTNAETGNIFDTIKNIAGAVKTSAVPRTETVAATSSFTESKSIVQNIEINNEFKGDKAGQKKSKEAMDKASDDVTDELARGLTYVR